MSETCPDCGFKMYKASDFRDIKISAIHSLTYLYECINCKNLKSSHYLWGFKEGYQKAKKRYKPVKKEDT